MKNIFKPLYVPNPGGGSCSGEYYAYSTCGQVCPSGGYRILEKIYEDNCGN